VDGIAEEAIGRGGAGGRLAAGVATAIARAERVAPRREAREPGQRAVAGQAIEPDEPGGAGDERLVGDEQERREGDDLARDGVGLAAVDDDGPPVGGERAGDDPRGGIGAEQRRAGGVQPAASSSAAR